MPRKFYSAAVVVLVWVLSVTGCAMSELVSEERDMSGLTEREVAEMSIHEQYARAGEQYAELNELFAELQREIYVDEWREGGTRSEVVPGQGYTLASELRGDDRENSYYFTASRWHALDEDVKPVLQRIAESWESRGWEVSMEFASNHGSRVTARTEDRFWFAATDRIDDLELSGHSPVYWGESLPLVVAIGDRRDAERLAGHPWYDIERDEDNTVMRLPGVYRPFPAWETIPESPSAP